VCPVTVVVSTTVSRTAVAFVGIVASLIATVETAVIVVVIPTPVAARPVLHLLIFIKITRAFIIRGNCLRLARKTSPIIIFGHVFGRSVHVCIIMFAMRPAVTVSVCPVCPVTVVVSTTVSRTAVAFVGIVASLIATVETAVIVVVIPTPVAGAAVSLVLHLLIFIKIIRAFIFRGICVCLARVDRCRSTKVVTAIISRGLVRRGMIVRANRACAY